MLSRVTHSLLAVLAATALAGCVVTVREGPVEPINHSSAKRQPAKKSSGKAKPSSKNTGGTAKNDPTPTTGGGQTHKPADPTPATRPADPPAGRPGTTPTPEEARLPPTLKSDILFGTNQPGAFRGFVYGIPQGTSSLPDLGKMRPFAMLYRNKFDITPVDYKDGFPGLRNESDWFAIRYEGVVSLGAGAWRFRVVSDDGAMLYVDGNRVVDNDGTHPSISKSADIVLKSGGEHSIRLDYFHTTGPVSLMLLVANIRDGKETVLVGRRP